MNMDFLRDVVVDAPAKVVLHPPTDLVADVAAAEQALAVHRASGGEFNGPDPERLNELKREFYRASQALNEAEYSEASALLSSAKPRLDPARQVLVAAYADYVAVAQEVDQLRTLAEGKRAVVADCGQKLAAFQPVKRGATVRG